MDAATDSGPALTELETLATRFANFAPGLTKRGKPRKRRNLAALARACGVSEQDLYNAYNRGVAKMAAMASG